ncbi:MAG: GNAT family N-acetyltransferase [Pseudomonadota bacterium]
MASTVSEGSCWAQAVSDLAVRYALGAAGRGAKVTVVDLEPPGRRDAGSLLRCRLQGVAELMESSGIRLQYLACPQPGTASPPEGAQPHLQWDANHPEVPPVAWPSGEPWRPPGPVVVLMRDGWTRLEQRLMSAHYGRLFHWERERPQQPGSWLQLDADTYPPEAPGSLRHYLEGFNSFQFTLPVGALQALRGIAQWAARGWLVLAHADGWADRQDFRLPAGELLAPQRIRDWQLPVNFDWLAVQCPGALSWQSRVGTDEVLQLMMGGDGADARSLAELARPLQTAPFSVARHLARSIRVCLEHGDTEAALALLRLSGWDAHAFEQALPRAIGALEATHGFHKADWAEALARVWENRPTDRDDIEFLRGFAHAALACRQVAAARRAVDLLSMRGAPQPQDLLLQAQCLDEIGQLQQALIHCDRALALDARIAGGAALRAGLAAAIARHREPWRTPYRLPGCALQLEPLHTNHAHALLHQYRDAQIAVMTGLPRLTTLAEASDWITRKLGEGDASYAIVHAELGLVGYLDLELLGERAYLCIWIGTDFQGRGFASPAIELACRRAFDNGIAIVMSSVYDDNLRSFRALERCGFTKSALRACAPHDERTFVYRARDAAPGCDMQSEIVLFVCATNPDIRFPEPACT